jgi:N-acetylglutamate synthase-like GNAT family acetyltransferase
MSTATVSTCEENVSKKDEKIDTLEFVRLKIPKLIPKDLIENVKGRTFTTEQFYEYQTKQVGNPYNFLYALVDKDKKIHGYLWAETNLLDGSLFVNTFSVSKEHWGKGEAIEKVCEFLKVLKKTSKASRVFWVTTNEKFFIKKGFKKSKNVLMEYNSN